MGVCSVVGVMVVLLADVGGGGVLVDVGGNGVSVDVGGNGVLVDVGGRGAVAVGIGAVGVGRLVGLSVGVDVGFRVITAVVGVPSNSSVAVALTGVCVCLSLGVEDGVARIDSGVVGWSPGDTIVDCPAFSVTVMPMAVTSTVPSMTLTSVTPSSLTLTENSVPRTITVAAGV